jgi:hypothetical protein
MFKGDWVLFHPVYTPQELKAVEVAMLISCAYMILIAPMTQVLHREAKTMSDKVAYGLAKFARLVKFLHLNGSAVLHYADGDLTSSLVTSTNLSLRPAA